MGQKVLAQNDYFNDKTRFADLCNGVLFAGKQVIRPEELQEVNKRECDYRRNGILGKKSGLCWVGKNEKFSPVIPIVVYYGTDKKWDGATCLYEMLDIDKTLAPYIMNYRLNIFDYHDYTDYSMFKTENRELFEVLSCVKSEKKMDELIHKNEKRYRELAHDAAKLICDIAGIKDTLLIKTEGREVVDMCQAWDDHRQSGIKEGIRVFVEDKVEDGVSKETIIEKLMKRFHLDEGKAKNYYQKYGVK